MIIGAHEPMVFRAEKFGVWVECECHWIGPSCSTEASALAAHADHADALP